MTILERIQELEQLINECNLKQASSLNILDNSDCDNEEANELTQEYWRAYQSCNSYTKEINMLKLVHSSGYESDTE